MHIQRESRSEAFSTIITGLKWNLLFSASLIQTLTLTSLFSPETPFSHSSLQQIRITSIDLWRRPRRASSTRRQPRIGRQRRPCRGDLAGGPWPRKLRRRRCFLQADRRFPELVLPPLDLLDGEPCPWPRCLHSRCCLRCRRPPWLLQQLRRPWQRLLRPGGARRTSACSSRRRSRR